MKTLKIPDELAGRALLVDIEFNGNTEYSLPPPTAGFFKFSKMRTRKNIDQKLFSELFYQYITEEDDFIRVLFTEGETQPGRTFVNEQVLNADNALYVPDYEHAGEVIETATSRDISMCYCRHKKIHADQACDAAMDTCMTFNTTAALPIRHGHARKVDVAEGIDLQQQAHEKSVLTPVNGASKAVGMALERGKLQHFLFVTAYHSDTGRWLPYWA